MTAFLYHYYEIIKTGSGYSKEWLFCAVYDEKKAFSKLNELRQDNPGRIFTFDVVKY